MRIMWIGGNHPRHLYLVNFLSKKFSLSGAIVEQRDNIMPQIPKNISPQDSHNFVRHFENRLKAEKKYFGKQKLPTCPILKVNRNNLNLDRSVKFVKHYKPDVVLIFGSGLIKNPLFDALPPESINLHLGLSPKYRGSAGLFWPFYFMEPGFTGSTFHYIISEPDAGDIIHQVIPKLSVDDTIHDVACKTVIASAKELIPLLKIFKKNMKWKRYNQVGTGKLFLAKDFRPEHLRVIYNLFNDDMVKQALKGHISFAVPKLIRQY